MTAPKLIAFYLPQFHPTKENDLWWGKGFTEWTNVTKSTPLFDGHYQPHLPSDLGFYDLRLKESRLEQYKLAKEYGIYGFCYHYYWFSGERILNRPIDEMLANKDEEMPFCFCWANENWTRRWDAAEHEILIAQRYLPDDDLNFIKSLVPFLQDKRYIRVDGKPLIVVYRPQHLPDSKKSIQIWKTYCRTIGISDLHICCALTHGNEDYEGYGFDGGVEFPPHNLKVRHSNEQLSFHKPFSGLAVQYSEIATSYLNREYVGKNIYKTVFPSWDNSARVSYRAVVMLNGTPTNYEHWLKLTINKSLQSKSSFVFVNAWNEWAEGCHLEPDREYGRAFLEATKRAVDGISQTTNFECSFPCIEKKTLLEDLSLVLRKHLWNSIATLRQFITKRPKVKRIFYPIYRFFSKTDR
jgi:lipopolysaccharide biosynthesis protein